MRRIVKKVLLLFSIIFSPLTLFSCKSVELKESIVVNYTTTSFSADLEDHIFIKKYNKIIDMIMESHDYPVPGCEDKRYPFIYLEPMYKSLLEKADKEYFKTGVLFYFQSYCAVNSDSTLTIYSYEIKDNIINIDCKQANRIEIEEELTDAELKEKGILVVHTFVFLPKEYVNFKTKVNVNYRD